MVESQPAFAQSSSAQVHNNTFAGLQAALESLWPFIALFARFELLIHDQLPIPLDTTVIWQLLAIVINSSLTIVKQAKATEFVFRFIREIGRQLEYFVKIIPTSSIHSSDTAGPELLQNLVDIVNTLSDIYRCFHDPRVGSGMHTEASMGVLHQADSAQNDSNSRSFLSVSNVNKSFPTLTSVSSILRSLLSLRTTASSSVIHSIKMKLHLFPAS